MKELVEKINYLARKSREEGLTPKEKEEQQDLRRKYIENIKSQLRFYLEPEEEQNEGKNE